MSLIRLWILHFRVWFLEAQIENAAALLEAHEAMLERCHKDIRRLRSQIATQTPANSMLKKALGK